VADHGSYNITIYMEKEKGKEKGGKD